jgi:site-specific DNA-cytosine methylase
MMCGFLERAGYTVEAAVIDPRDYGELCGRKRTVIVAHTFENFSWPELTPCTKTVKDILDKPEDVEHLYFNADDKPWLVNHWKTQTEKGNGFAAPQLTEDTRSVPTITKQYQSIRGDAPVLCHPKKPSTWRLFTVSETARLHGLDPHTYQLDPNSKTLSGEVLGQGVIVTFFEKIIRATRNLIPARGGSARKTKKEVEPSAEINIGCAQASLAFA